jgi:N-acetyl-alpha-D-muramate 1-phosphate uridylyltransferase
MDAMIFAAGLGTRLRPLTDTTPKALIDIGGRPILERVARRLIAAGATRLIVNVHHHAEQIRRFLGEHDGFGVEWFVSDESELLLDTGGGLKAAGRYFRRDGPFLLHNGDIYTDIDLSALYHVHTLDAVATLAVMNRDTTRHLLFDDDGMLVGAGNTANGYERRAREPRGSAHPLGFCGIHVISPRIFDMITEEGVFSIIDLYMRLAGSGERIAAHRVDDALWIDIGKPEQLERARHLAAERQVDL